jgi:hypothetical protein
MTPRIKNLGKFFVMVNYFKNAARTILCASKPGLSIVKAMTTTDIPRPFYAKKKTLLAFATLKKVMLAENIYRINFPNNHHTQQPAVYVSQN